MSRDPTASAPGLAAAGVDGPTGAPAERLAQGFARRVTRWALEINPGYTGLDLLAEAARLASLATAEGHVCADLHGWPPGDRERLLASGLVALAGDGRELPLALDADGRLYLRRYFAYEARLAGILRRMALTPAGAPSPAARERLHQLFAEAGSNPDWQKIAAGMALLGQLTVISGGPGTGKTTTVVKLLACLLTDHPECRIALLAPTGKAAARMVEALRGQVERLLAAGQLPSALTGRLPREASTVHRLLGTDSRGGFRHHADNPLPYDVLVVDEASMLDLALATRLAEAIPPGARLILLGDKDQLAAVEAGAVFSEIAGNPALTPGRRDRLAELTRTPAELIQPRPALRVTHLPDAVVWFTQNYRFHEAPGIGRLAALVQTGDDAAALAWLGAGDTPNVSWSDVAGAGLAQPLRESLLEGYAAYLAALPDGPPDAEQLDAVFAAYNGFRILCAVRESPRGVNALNDWLATACRARRRHPLDRQPRSPWYPGRPVMVLRNDYASRLFNGDIGIVLPAGDEGEFKVYFPDGASGYRAVPPTRLPDHATAFAMTVHKSQGSEFDEIALILPGGSSRVLTRELVYTGITRARRQVRLITAPAILAEGIRTPTQRRSGLLARLAALDAV